LRILFITTHNLATNPRIVKEINLALSRGHQVQVLCFEYNNWSRKINEQLVDDLRRKASVVVIPSGRKPLLPWLLSSLMYVVAGKFLYLFPSHKWLLSIYSNKRSIFLLNALKRNKFNSDLIVGHTPGAFYPCYKFSQDQQVPFGIDLEDYHAGETEDPVHAKRIRTLCSQTLPAAAYLSAASPLILQYSLRDLGSYPNKTIVINNSFSISEFILPQPSFNDKLKLVWFSQNIDRGRGLEQMVPVMKQLGDLAELHLYGNLKDDFYEAWLKGLKNIIVHQPLPQPALHRELARYDIGLAIEPNKDINNSIAVSNKINAYLQGGLYIIASDTPAQKEWMLKMNASGELVQLNDEKHVVAILTGCLNEVDKIRSEAPERFSAAKAYAWENESLKLLQTWQADKVPVMEAAF
jgi:glycosyltransferase involved in cell wall biosynthesis